MMKITVHAVRPQVFAHLNESDLTIEDANQLFNYDPKTGSVTRKITRGSQPSGSLVGTSSKGKYLKTQVKRKDILVHRLAWFLFYGEWPKGLIDHINGNGMDNRITNLRTVTHAENAKNRSRQANNRTGVSGVTVDGKKYRVLLGHNYKIRYGGRFDTLEEATVERNKLATALGFHSNHGRA